MACEENSFNGTAMQLVLLRDSQLLQETFMARLDKNNFINTLAGLHVLPCKVAPRHQDPLDMRLTLKLRKSEDLIAEDIEVRHIVFRGHCELVVHPEINKVTGFVALRRCWLEIPNFTSKIWQLQSKS